METVLTKTILLMEDILKVRSSTQAIEDAYKTFTMVHKFPFAVLHFTLDTAELDVNVHPTKMEVRFSHGQELYKFIYESLRHVLLGKELIPEVKPSEPKKTTAAVRPGRIS